MTAKVEFYDAYVGDDEDRDGAEPIACVLLDHVPRRGDKLWLKPFGWYFVTTVEYEVDSRRFNCGVRDVNVWLKKDLSVVLTQEQPPPPADNPG